MNGVAGDGYARYRVQSGQEGSLFGKQGGTTENSFVPEWTEVFLFQQRFSEKKWQTTQFLFTIPQKSKVNGRKSGKKMVSIIPTLTTAGPNTMP